MADISRSGIDIADLLARVQRLEQDKAPKLVRFGFSNLISNGGFDAGVTGWTPTSGISFAVVSGQAVMTYLAAHTDYSEHIFRTISGLTIGRNYRINYSHVAGSRARVTWSHPYISMYSTTATAFNFTPTAAAGTLQVFSDGASEGHSTTVDNFSLWEADPSDDAPWLRLPRGWTVGDYGHVYRDGSYLHPDDYTEITVLDQTWIKPLVAPGVDTQFDIWGYQA